MKAEETSKKDEKTERKKVYSDVSSDFLLLNPFPLHLPIFPPQPTCSAACLQHPWGSSPRRAHHGQWGTLGRWGTTPESVALPIREFGPLYEQGNRPLQYWLFSSYDLYNWKTHNPSFSDNPQALTSLIESLLFPNQTTGHDCQQLFQTLLTTEKRQRVLLEAHKNVPGADGRPTQLPNEIDARFPLTRLTWDFNTSEGREHLRVYCQALAAGTGLPGTPPIWPR